MDDAMRLEWNTWQEFKATQFCSADRLADSMKRNPKVGIVGMRWVRTEKGTGYKARLVVQGCQEKQGFIRTDAPTGSRAAFFLTVAAGAQSQWQLDSYDAKSA